MPSTRGHGGDTATNTQTIPDAVPQRRPIGTRIALVFYGYGADGAEIALLDPATPLVVGRAPSGGVCINDRSLSREHALFVLDDGRVHVRDLGSKNGTFVLGQRVDRAVLQLGDEASLGSVQVRVQPLGTSGASLGIDGEDAFRRHLDEELARAVQFRRPFALLLVRAVVQANAEQDIADEQAASWLEALRSRVRPVDRIAAYGIDAVQVLLPETGAEEAACMAAAITAPLADGQTRLFAGVAVYPDAGRTSDALVERSRQALRLASPAHPVELSFAPAWTAEEAAADETIVVGAATSDLLATIERVAASRLPIILHGETGTGKEVFAGRIHEAGPRKAKRMVRVNCGAIPKELVESTLFGHERGAFTGAVQQHKGVFEEADGGTVFLDEIGELPPAAQTALLRVLEMGSFCRVGSTREIAVDVRIVAATHRDLESMASARQFRADLYYRLNGIMLDIPPLRERKDEIAPLARRFLRLANEANGLRVEGINRDAMAILTAYRWPGNVRELRNAVERAVVVTPGTLIGPADLPARMRAAGGGEHAVDLPRSSKPVPPSSPTSAPSPVSSDAPAPDPSVLDKPARGRVQHYEEKLLRDTLEATGWNRTAAAQRLGMPLRTLSYRMKVLGIQKPGV